MTQRTTIGRGAALCALVAITLGLPMPARAATPGVRVAHATVALRPRDPAALARYVQAISTPGSTRYGRFLTPRQFGARFGARPQRIAAVVSALRARGLAVGPASAGGLSIPLTVTAQQLRAHPAVGALVARALPAPLRPAVRAVIAFGPGAAARPLAVRDTRRRSRLTRPLAGGGRPTGATAPGSGPQPCAAAAANAQQYGTPTDPQIASAYGFDSLYAAGDEGAGTTIAVYELEPDDPSDIAHFQSCYGTHADVSYVHVDGGAGAGAGSDEAALDIENLVAFAPRARLLVYQGPNAQTGLPGSGPYDVYSAIVNQNRARIISVSWGQCEHQLGAPAQAAENDLFEQAAVQGQTVVAAAGDNGAQDCDTGGPRSSLAPAVDDPASQPLVVGVGGTSLRSVGPPPQETVWNDGGPGGSGIGAGGGGVSASWAMGPDQLDTPAFLHVRQAAARGPACGQRSAYCREVPDVSADADPATGYDIYWNGADSEPEPSGWQVLGGTSAAAPVWAALFALADASPACAGAPLGFAGPALYRAAAGGYAADFHDVTTGDNDFTGTSGGRWPAGPGYDLASGLGTPNAGPLVAALCADTIRLGQPSGQSSAVRAAIAVRLRARDRRGARLRFSARHLPPGVRLQARSGRIVGRPRTPGRYRVHVAVRDGRGARAGRSFTWVVGGAPRVSAARVLGVGGRRRLEITIACGRHVPWLRSLRVHLPSGLTAGGPRPAVRARGRAAARVHGSVVTVSLGSPSPSVHLALPVRGNGRVSPLSIGVRAGSTGTSVLRAQIAGRRS